MTVDTAAVLAAIALALLWPIHQQLTIRALRRAIHQLHQRQRQHAGAIIQLQTTVAETPLQVHAPMPRVGRRPVAKVTATISGDASLQPHTTYDSPEVRPGVGGWARSELWGKEHGPEVFKPSRALRAALADVPELTGKEVHPDPDPTLRLQRPLSILPAPEPATDIEQVLTAATRPLTRNEIAGHLDRPGWELIPELAALIKAGKIAPTQGHDLDLAYRLVPSHSDTVRLAKMPVLPGVRP